MQKSAYISMLKAGETGGKVNRADLKVSRANAQSRPSGILLSSDNSKLCFALLTSFSAAQNHLPFGKGGIHSEVVHPKGNIRQLKSPRAFVQKQAGFYLKGGGLLKNDRRPFLKRQVIIWETISNRFKNDK